MNKYEILFILDNAAADEAKEAMIAKMTSLISENGGNVEKVDKWGAKKLAYPINYKTEGYYVLMNYECAPELISEMERQLRISDMVMRHMVIKK